MLRIFQSNEMLCISWTHKSFAFVGSKNCGIAPTCAEAQEFTTLQFLLLQLGFFTLSVA